MKFKTLNITGFGHFSEQTFELDEKSQLIFGENEAGKSTLYHFIRTILFGFPKKREQIRDFTPRSGQRYGGNIVIQHGTYGEVTIERFKETRSGQAKVILPDGQEGNDYLLEKLLAPLTKDVFDQIFSFQQEQLLDLGDLNETKLQHLLLTVGLTGSEQLNQVSQRFFKKRQQLFKPTGRVPKLNQKLTQFKVLETKIEQVEQEEATYQAKQLRYQEIERDLSKASAIKKQLIKQRDYLANQQKRISQYVEWETLNKERQPEKRVSDEQLKEIETTFQEYRFLEKKEHKLLKQHEGLNDLSSPAYLFYLNNQRQLEETLSHQLQVERLSQQLATEQHQIQQIEDEKAALYHTYDLKPIQASEADMQKVITSIREVAEEEEEFIRDKIVLDNEISRVTLRRKELDYQLTTLEKELKLHEKQAKTTEEKEANSLNLPIVLIGGAAVLAVIAGFSSATWLFLIVGLLVAIGVFMIWRSAKEQKELERIPQIDISHPKEQYAVQLAQSDENEREYHRLQSEKETLQMKLNVILEQKVSWNKLYGLNPKESLNNWLSKLPVYYQIMALEEKKQHAQESLKALKEELSGYQDCLAFASDWLLISGQEVKNGYQLLSQFIKEQQSVREEVQLLEGEQASIPMQLTRIREDLQKLEVRLQSLIPQLTNFHSDKVVRFLAEQEAYREEEQRLADLTLRLEDYFDLSKSYQLATINEDYFALTDQLDQWENNQEEQQKESQALRFDLQKMEEKGTLDELYQQRENDLTEIKELAEAWLGYKLAEDILQEVFDYLSDQQLPQVLALTSEYFSILTGGKYPQVVFKQGKLIVQDRKLQKWEATQLSTGTKDQLYIAFRLGFIQLHAHDYDAPIMIDDGWLHFDSGRKEIFFKVMIALGKTRQIICLSSDEEMKAYFEKNGIDIINLGGKK